MFELIEHSLYEGESYAVRDQKTGYFLHNDGREFKKCPEWFPTRELAQVVLDKYQPKHVWEHGDVVECYDGAIVICIKKSGEEIRIFGIDGVYKAEYDVEINLDGEATFLFNIREKL